MTIVVYHSADYDGIFCREIAKRFLGPGNANDPNQYIGWNFGDPPLSVPVYGNHIYVMDLPVDRVFGKTFVPGTKLDWPGLIWIDHHKSSIESHPADIPGYRIDGVAACRLAWQWFAHPPEGYQRPDGENDYTELPGRQAYFDRKVSEPLAVRLVGEYDVAGPNANEEALDFQFGLRSTEIAGDEEQLLTCGEFGDAIVNEISERGVVVRAYLDRSDALTAQSAFAVELDGIKCLAINSYRGNSKAMQQAASKDSYSAVMSFAYRSGKWTVSLYGVPGKDVDLSEIAKKHGGGGHKTACGFECKTLPFPL